MALTAWMEWPWFVFIPLFLVAEWAYDRVFAVELPKPTRREHIHGVVLTAMAIGLSVLMAWLLWHVR